MVFAGADTGIFRLVCRAAVKGFPFPAEQVKGWVVQIIDLIVSVFTAGGHGLAGGGCNEFRDAYGGTVIKKSIEVVQKAFRFQIALQAGFGVFIHGLSFKAQRLFVNDTILNHCDVIYKMPLRLFNAYLSYMKLIMPTKPGMERKKTVFLGHQWGSIRKAGEIVKEKPEKRTPESSGRRVSGVRVEMAGKLPGCRYGGYPAAGWGWVCHRLYGEKKTVCGRG